MQVGILGSRRRLCNVQVAKDSNSRADGVCSVGPALVGWMSRMIHLHWIDFYR